MSSALPDLSRFDTARTFNEAYEVGYLDGFAAGVAAERDAIAKRLAEDVARRLHEHTTWVSVKSGRVLKSQNAPRQRAKKEA